MGVSEEVWKQKKLILEVGHPPKRKPQGQIPDKGKSAKKTKKMKGTENAKEPKKNQDDYVLMLLVQGQPPSQVA